MIPCRTGELGLFITHNERISAVFGEFEQVNRALCEYQRQILSTHIIDSNLFSRLTDTAFEWIQSNGFWCSPEAVRSAFGRQSRCFCVISIAHVDRLAKLTKLIDFSWIPLFFGADSIVPVTICLLIEKGLAASVVRETAGMAAHVMNIIVLVLIPMVIIHVHGDAFTLSKCTNSTTPKERKFGHLFRFIWYLAMSRCVHRIFFGSDFTQINRHELNLRSV